jgi:methionyl aminopeptidase
VTEIYIKSDSEIAVMRHACKLATDTLLSVGDMIREGMTTAAINDFSHEYITSRGGVPAPLGYRGYPKSICTSINEVVCHGIPDEKTVLRNGDILNVDITAIVDGWHGDTSATFFIGKPSREARHVVEVARRCLDIGIAQVHPGGRIYEIGNAIDGYAASEGCSVIRDYVGHGIGRGFHEKPQVPHFANSGEKARMLPGMTFTIEPMINLGTWRTKVLGDGWTAVTADRSLSAQFEHTVLVTPDGVEVLTARDRVLRNSESLEDGDSMSKEMKAGRSGPDKGSA